MLGVLAWSSFAFGGEIHDAAMKGDLAKVKALLQDHPDLIISEDADGETPLHWAAAFDQEDMVDLLLANTADGNTKTNKAGETPLHAAAAKGNKGVAEKLLIYKAEVNAKDSGGNTPWPSRVRTLPSIRPHACSRISSALEKSKQRA